MPGMIPGPDDILSQLTAPKHTNVSPLYPSMSTGIIKEIANPSGGGGRIAPIFPSRDSAVVQRSDVKHG